MSSCPLSPILWPNSGGWKACWSGMVRQRFLLPCNTIGKTLKRKRPTKTINQSINQSIYLSIYQSINQSKPSNQIKPNQTNQSSQSIKEPTQLIKQPYNQAFKTFAKGNSAIHIARLPAFDSRWRTVLISSSKVSGRRILGSPRASWVKFSL